VSAPAALKSLAFPPAVQALDFVSDLHLSPEVPQTVGAFERFLAQSSADALFILGDLFEVWVGDDALEQDFERACAATLRSATARRPVYLLPGNRDFLLGARFYAETGVQALDDPCLVDAFGSKVLLSHGDALCLDDHEYQAFRRQVRAQAWQADFLARPLAERLALAAQMRAASLAHQRRPDGGPAAVTFADADPSLALQWLDEAGSHVLIHGHTHRPTSEQREGGWQRHVLSDWDLDHATPHRAEVLRWTAQGFARLAPALA